MNKRKKRVYTQEQRDAINKRRNARVLTKEQKTAHAKASLKWNDKNIPYIDRICVNCSKNYTCRSNVTTLTCSGCSISASAVKVDLPAGYDDSDTKFIDNRKRYRDSCKRCDKDKGYVRKNDLGKNCKSCATTLSSIPRRGIYYDNTRKKSLRSKVSYHLRSILREQKFNGGGRVFDALGYSDFIAHIDSKLCNGMTWANMDEWHLDHIIPESSFDYSSFEDEGFKRCWSLDNLQPLWAIDNIKKSNKLDFILPIGYNVNSR